MAQARLIGSRPTQVKLAVAAILAILAACVAAGTSFIHHGDIWVRTALSFTYLETAAALLLVPGLVWAKHMRLRKEEVSARRREQILGWLAPGGDVARARAAAGRWPEEFLSTLQRALSRLEGSEAGRLAELAVSSGLLPALLEDCVGAHPNRAVRALRILSEIDDDRCRDAIRAAVSHDSPLVRAAAKRVILTRGSPAARFEVLSEMISAPLWERVVLYHAAASDMAVTAEFLTTALASTRDELILVALEMIHSSGRLIRCTVPARLAQSTNPEVRIKFFKALPFLEQDGYLGDVLRQGLRDPDWRVRAMAAQASARLHVPSLAEDLLRICTVFEHPAEAAHGARALAALGGEARLRLESLIGSGSPAGSSIAAEVIEAQLMKGAVV